MVKNGEGNYKVTGAGQEFSANTENSKCRISLADIHNSAFKATN